MKYIKKMMFFCIFYYITSFMLHNILYIYICIYFFYILHLRVTTLLLASFNSRKAEFIKTFSLKY